MFKSTKNMAQQVISITLSEDEFDAKLSGAISAAIDKALSGFRPSSTEPRFYSRKEAAKKLQVTLPTLHTWTQEGRVNGHRVGSRVLYKEEDINNALQKIQTSIRATA